MPLGDYPKVAVKGLLDILLPQVGDIAVSQTAETGKDEQVPDVFQPFGNHFLFKDNFYLVLRQVAPIHFFQPDFVAGERVTHQYAVVAGNDDEILDKTGTITAGHPIVVESLWENGFEHTRKILYSLEKLSEHPLSDAVVKTLQNEKEISIDKFENVPGKGVKGMVGSQTYYVGNLSLLNDNHITIASHLQELANKWTQKAKTLVWFADSTQAIAAIALTDEIKQTSAEAISQLQKMGVEVYMLTGDNAISAQAISRKVGINHYKAGVLPNEKAQFIKELQANGKTVGMVGDGINDSAALAQADLSIAMGQGSDIAVDTAMATILSSDLLKIPETIRLSQLTIKTIYQNLFWAFIYNLIGIPIAAGIFYSVNGFLLNPMWASAAMAFSSVSVVLNSLRLKRKRI